MLQVRLYQVIETSTKLYLILELGDGGDMFDYIMRHERGLKECQAKEYFAQVCTEKVDGFIFSVCVIVFVYRHACVSKSQYYSHRFSIHMVFGVCNMHAMVIIYENRNEGSFYHHFKKPCTVATLHSCYLAAAALHKFVRILVFCLYIVALVILLEFCLYGPVYLRGGGPAQKIFWAYL